MSQNPENRSARVLLVDDDRQLCAMLADYLVGDGFRVTMAHDGRAGVEAVREDCPDAVVMDITMPVLDGFEAVRTIRTFSNVPVLMLTARGDELDRVVGLEIGADDYLSKPFSSRELAARLRAILRRARAGPGMAEPALEVGDLRADPASQSLFRAGQPVPVTATEFAIATALIASAGQVVPRADLSRDVLGRRLTPGDRSLDTHVSNLRRKLGPAPGGSPRIRTVRGKGYLLVAGPG